MIHLMDRSHDHVIGLEAHGRIDRADLDHALRILADAATRHGTVRLLVQLDQLPHFAANALLERLRTALCDRPPVERMAVVTDSKPIRRWLRVARLAVPHLDLHHFDARELDTAWRWLESPEHRNAAA